MVLSVVFIATYWGYNPTNAWTLVIRIGTFVLLFGHLRRAPRSSILVRLLASKPLTQVAYFILYINRSTSLVQRRLSDVQYALAVRFAQRGVSIWRKMWLWPRAGVSVMLELISIIDQAALALESRGEVVRTGLWIEQPKPCWTIAIGDVLLYGSVFALAWVTNAFASAPILRLMIPAIR